MTDLREQAALRDQCTVFLTGHGPVRPADLLASIPADTVPDRYGDGGVVAELEAEIAGLLGKPAAVYLPSGTMAQQSVLRVHADGRQRRTVVYHPLCHLDRHEDRAFQRLHGLTGRPAGDPDRLLTVDDLTSIAEPPGTLLIELPQRDLGGQQPAWDDLRAQTEWARERGEAAARRLAAEQGVWTWPQAMITPDPGVQRVELYVGDATRAVSPDKVRDIVVALTAS